MMVQECTKRKTWENVCRMKEGWKPGEVTLCTVTLLQHECPLQKGGGGDRVENSNAIITQQFSACWARMREGNVFFRGLVMCLAWVRDEEQI